MSAALDYTADDHPDTGTALTVIPRASLPTLIAADKTDILGKLRAELAGYTPDASTEAGRTEIGSKARKVGGAKQDFVRLAKTLKEDHQAAINKTNAELKEAEANFDVLRDTILAPREAYQQREKDRVAGHEDALSAISNMLLFDAEPTAMEINQRIGQLLGMPGRAWQEFQARADEAFASAGERLHGKLSVAHRREAEAAELERLRAEQTERNRLAAIREQAEREAQIAAQAAEQARLAAEAKAAEEAAEASEKAQKAAQQADYHRRMLQHVKDCGFGFIGGEPQASAILQHELTEKVKFDEENFGDLLPEALAARDGALKLIQSAVDARNERDRIAAEARAADERAAKSEADRLTAIETARLAAEKAERDRVAAEERAEQRRLDDLAAERKRVADEAEREAKAQRAREANVAHKSKIMREAKEALIEAGLGIDVAVVVVKAIAAGKITHVKMEF